MKPLCPRAPERVASIEFRGLERHHPKTDCCFQAGLREWRESSSGDEEPKFRNLDGLRRQSLAEAAREHATEMVVFAMMILPSIWVVTYMAVTVVKLLTRAHP